MLWGHSISMYMKFSKKLTFRTCVRVSRLFPANCLSAFDHFVGLALKRLRNAKKKRTC